jgi:hypothetical protein
MIKVEQDPPKEIRRINNKIEAEYHAFEDYYRL